MTTLLRYQPKQTLDRRYSSSSSTTSPTNEHYKHHDNTSNTVNHIDMNPHYQYLQSLYNDKHRELLHVQDIIHTQLTTINTSYNAITEVFYTKQRNTLLQWESDATEELQQLKEKLDSYITHSMIYNKHSNINQSSLSDTSSSSSEDD